MPLVRVAKCRDPESKAARWREVVMLRHDLRKLALNDGSLKIPEHEVGVTASYDGAILLGNYRGDFAGIVASRLPEDENDVATSFDKLIYQSLSARSVWAVSTRSSKSKPESAGFCSVSWT